MRPRIPFDAWRWPLAVVLSAGVMFLAAVAAGIAHQIFMALPRWAYPVVGCGGMVVTGMTIVLAKRHRRSDAGRALHPTSRKRF